MAGLFAMLFAPRLFAAGLQAQSLYQQALTRALGPAPPGVHLLLFHLRTRQPLVNTFAEQPIPVGSLLKPFLALAYARDHATFPAITCRGHADRCWSASGHGELTLAKAVAQSCNAYFLSLARGLDPADIPYLPAPPYQATPETLIGLTPAWPVAALTLVQAYAALLTARRTPAVAALHEGMRLSAICGTAAGVGPHRGGVLAKTGTAPCIANCRASGDGLIVTAVPAVQPRLLLLVHRKATTGATTAAEAGRLLTRLESLHA